MSERAAPPKLQQLQIPQLWNICGLTFLKVHCGDTSLKRLLTRQRKSQPMLTNKFYCHFHSNGRIDRTATRLDAQSHSKWKDSIFPITFNLRMKSNYNYCLAYSRAAVCIINSLGYKCLFSSAWYCINLPWFYPLLLSGVSFSRVPNCTLLT